MVSRALCIFLAAALLLASPAAALIKIYCSPGGYDRQSCGTDADVSRVCNSTPLQNCVITEGWVLEGGPTELYSLVKTSEDCPSAQPGPGGPYNSWVYSECIGAPGGP